MDTVSRRKFLLASGVAGAAAIGTGSIGLSLADLLRTAIRDRDDNARKDVTKLVVVTLYGGNDGLNTVIPYADPAYHSARPELAYAPEKVLHLNESLGLNPLMPGMKRLWDEKRLAVVLGVGYPKPDRSHFRSMDIWQTASPVRPVPSGWIGRWLDAEKAAPETAVSFEPVLPPLLAGESRAGSCVSHSGLKLPAGIDQSMVAALGQMEPNESEMRARAALAYADMLKVEQLVREADDTPELTDDKGLLTTGPGTSPLARQLSLVAQCIEAGVPTQVYSVSLDGFDTHASERIYHEKLVTRLDRALAGFVNRMAQTENGRQVAVVVYSEFGRRVRANASDGTDHGTAGPVFITGPRVAGGFYGEQPSLTDLDDGDLKATMDFRDVFGTLLGSVLRADPARYLDGYDARMLPVFSAG
ncbi:DUF1501 domain-containing protein [Micromonospora sp. CPCC 205371]|nr:DUF1501 domain-containing protein [Micromonospora sp. CPCC 205371]